MAVGPSPAPHQRVRSGLLMSAETGQVEEAYGRLQRGLLRVAFSFRGRTSEFDAHLKRLGRAIKTGAEPAELRELIDRSIDLIVSMSGPDDSRGVLEALTRHLAIGDAEKRRILAQIRDDDLNADALPDLVARTINASLNRNASRPDAPASNTTELLHGVAALVPMLPLQSAVAQDLTERIEGMRQNGGTDLDAIERLLREIARLATPGAPRDAGDGAVTGTVSPECIEVLNLLVERIPFPASVDGELKSIRQNLSTLSDRDQLKSVTLQLADLIAKMKTSAQRELSELGTFLKRITDDLLGLQTNLHDSADAHRRSLEDSHELNQEIGDRVSEMQAECEASNDIESLRSAVGVHLGEIGRRLSAFVETQTERHQDAETSLSSLKARVNELESEASELRRTLATQQEQAIIDPLTRVPNRLGFEQQLGDELDRWERYRSNLSLAVIDIDHFKRINDGFGHAAGDKVLVAVAQQIREAIRRTDRVSRYGGEEFVVLLPETDLPAAFRALDKVRDVIANCQFQYKEERVPVTISIGIAQFGEADTFDSVFERADAALYQAKSGGRNLCICDGIEPAPVTALHA